MTNIFEKGTFLYRLLLNTANQIVTLLGVILLFGLLLYLFARFTRKVFSVSFGQKFEIYFTAWIGTPVHEIGHTIFCILFRHKIQKINLFTPNSTDSTLGFVKHSYNSKSIYQQIGNFFIGLGPILFGSIVIYYLMYFLVPNNETLLKTIHTNEWMLKGFSIQHLMALSANYYHGLKSILMELFNTSNYSSIVFWIFVYLSICISTHMELSPSDIKSFGLGFLFLILLLLLVNAIILSIERWGFNNNFGLWWDYIRFDGQKSIIQSGTSTLAALLSLSTAISGSVLLVSYIILSIVNLLRGRGLINPF